MSEFKVTSFNKFMLGFCDGLGGGDFSIIAIDTCAEGAEAAENAGLPDLK